MTLGTVVGLGLQKVVVCAPKTSFTNWAVQCRQDGFAVFFSSADLVEFLDHTGGRAALLLTYQSLRSSPLFASRIPTASTPPSSEPLTTSRPPCTGPPMTTRRGSSALAQRLFVGGDAPLGVVPKTTAAPKRISNKPNPSARPAPSAVLASLVRQGVLFVFDECHALKNASQTSHFAGTILNEIYEATSPPQAQPREETSSPLPTSVSPFPLRGCETAAVTGDDGDGVVPEEGEELGAEGTARVTAARGGDDARGSGTPPPTTAFSSVPARKDPRVSPLALPSSAAVGDPTNQLAGSRALFLSATPFDQESQWLSFLVYILTPSRAQPFWRLEDSRTPCPGRGARHFFQWCAQTSPDVWPALCGKLRAARTRTTFNGVLWEAWLHIVQPSSVFSVRPRVGITGPAGTTVASSSLADGGGEGRHCDPHGPDRGSTPEVPSFTPSPGGGPQAWAALAADGEKAVAELESDGTSRGSASREASSCSPMTTFRPLPFGQQPLQPAGGAPVLVERFTVAYLTSKAVLTRVTRAYRDLVHLVETSRQQGRSIEFGGLTGVLQNIETAKVPVFVTAAVTALGRDSATKVVVAVRFLHTLTRVAEMLRPYGVVAIRGDMTHQERVDSVAAFQHSHDVRAIVITLGAASSGIDLDDQTGDHPRVLVLSADYSAVAVSQVCGRVARLTTKSPVLIIVACTQNVRVNKVGDELEEGGLPIPTGEPRTARTARPHPAAPSIPSASSSSQKKRAAVDGAASACAFPDSSDTPPPTTKKPRWGGFLLETAVPKARPPPPVPPGSEAAVMRTLFYKAQVMSDSVAHALQRSTAHTHPGTFQYMLQIRRPAADGSAVNVGGVWTVPFENPHANP